MKDMSGTYILKRQISQKLIIALLFILVSFLLLSCLTKEKQLNSIKDVSNIQNLKKSEMVFLIDFKAPLNKILQVHNQYTINEIVLLRNSIYAQHGYEFSTSWLREYFESRKWYSPGGYTESKLSSIDKINIKNLLDEEKLLYLKAELKKYNFKTPQLIRGNQNCFIDIYQCIYLEEDQTIRAKSCIIGGGEDPFSGVGNWQLTDGKIHINFKKIFYDYDQDGINSILIKKTEDKIETKLIIKKIDPDYVYFEGGQICLSAMVPSIMR